MAWLIRLSAAFIVVMGSCAMPAAMAVDVSGDDANDQFVGSGQSGSRSDGAGASTHQSCADCSWMAADPCSSPYNTIACGHVTDGCSAGQEQRRFWLSTDGGQTWEDHGLRCVNLLHGAGGQPSSRILRETFVQAVPSAVISSQPSGGLLPQVPTLFSSGQPVAPAPSTHHIGALRIQLSPVARWHWDFGDGTELDTQNSGSRYPDRAVAHTYRTAGEFQVRLRTTWTATYTVDGQGPFTVEGSVTQLASARIRVGQGRAVLS